MFWGLASGAVDPRGFEFEHVLQDIQTLNEWALEGRLEVSAISLHAYPFVQDRYVILPHGASMGSGYGPVVVSREPLTRKDLRDVEIAVPGRMTTAFLVLRLFLGGEFRYREVPFDQIIDEVRSRRASDAGLLIHEGQLTYEHQGCSASSTSASGGCSRRACRCRSGSTSRGATSARSVCTSSPRCWPSRSRPGSRTARRRSPTRCSTGAGSTAGLADRFVGMYVNELTQDYGDEGRQAVQRAPRARRAEQARSTRPVRVEFVS